MPAQVLNQAGELIRERLTAIAGERERLEREQAELEAVLDSMPDLGGIEQDQTSARTRTRPKTSGAGRRRTSSKRHVKSGDRKRAPKGQRQEQFLGLVKSNPGQPIAEMAKQIGVGPTQLYPIVRRLKAEGQIQPRDDGFELVAE